MKHEVLIVPKERYLDTIAENTGMLPFPDHDAVPFSENSPSTRWKRLNVLFKIMEGDTLRIVTTLSALARYTISRSELKNRVIDVKRGIEFIISPDDLVELGYTRVDIVREPGQFAVRGDIIDVFSPSRDLPIRIELFDDVIEDIRMFDPMTQRSVSSMGSFKIIPAREYTSKDHIYDTVVGVFSDETAFDYLKEADFMLWNPQNVWKEFERRMKKLFELARDRIEDYKRWSFIDPSKIQSFLKDAKIVSIDADFKRMRIVEDRTAFREIPLVDTEDIEPGDIVVHKDYGLGRFEGVVTLSGFHGVRDYLKIVYKDSTLYVPVERISRVHKYIGSDDVELDSLSSKSWKNRVKRIRKEIEAKVRELVKLYIKRSEVKGLSLPGDPEMEDRFARTFPFIETRDQLRAIEEVLRDLESDKPMDRLVCGDSGYGKTEVALRATFRTVISGKQVALIVPTVVLAGQHYRTFRDRLEPFGVVVELLDSTRTKAEKLKVLRDLKRGRIDVIIGTHALLSDRVVFSDLGLVIVDEEHKFGVIQKEKLKKLRLSVNVLSMSATPIPRTLRMAMSGMKDVSVLNTPPVGRKPVVVHVSEYSEKLIKAAILREMTRGGQIIYVHNRIEELDEVARKLSNLVPDINFAVAHGRMNKKRLERTVESFYSGELDLLLCTSIVESGLDIPTANTIIVDDSHRYGLAQLYQLRGRVGRRDVKGFAYFLYPKGVSKNVMKRLEILKKFVGPGSGMEIALKDMEMRGYGDLLGIDQHGYVSSIGYKYYVEMLKSVLSEVKGETETEEIDVEIEGFPGSISIPEDYISDPMERMRIYRWTSSAGNLEDVEDARRYLEDVYGRPPESVKNLLRIARLRVSLRKIGVEKLLIHGDSLVLEYRGKKPEIPIDAISLDNPKKRTLVLYNISLEDFERSLSRTK